jgi:hypothetical protein
MLNDRCSAELSTLKVQCTNLQLLETCVRVRGASMLVMVLVFFFAVRAGMPSTVRFEAQRSQACKVT